MKKLLVVVAVLLVAAPLMAKEIELVPIPVEGVGIPGHFYNLPPAPKFPSEQELSNDNGTPYIPWTGSMAMFNTITIPYDCWLILVRGYIGGYGGTGDVTMDVLEDSGGTPVWGSSLIGGSVPVYYDDSDGWKDSADFDPLIFFSNGTVTHPGQEAGISNAGIYTDTDFSGSGGCWYYYYGWYDYTFFGHIMARLLVNDDVAGPYGGQYNPADGDTAAPDTNIVWHCYDDDIGVDSDTINTDSFLVEVAKSKVSGTITITGDPSDYEVTFDPDSDFSEGDTVNVTLSPPDYAILDQLTNSMDEVTYSFTVGAYVTVQPTSLGYIKAMYE